MHYLANCTGNSLADKAWRHFWFKYVLHKDAIEGWTQNSSGLYEVNQSALLIERSDGQGSKVFFVGRKDSVKNKIVALLNDVHPLSLDRQRISRLDSLFRRQLDT